MVFSVVVLLLKYNFCLCNIYIPMSFIEELGKLKICLRIFSPSVLSDYSKTCYFRTVFTLLLSTMVSMRHIYC